MTAASMTADHGGHNRNHGDDVPEDMTIPVVLKGKRFPSGTELEAVPIKDIAGCDGCSGVSGLGRQEPSAEKTD